LILFTASIPMPALSVTLPWPSKDLSPNARLHWARKAKAVKQARAGAHFLILEARGHARRIGEAAKLSMTFCPPDKRRRDRDNLIASMKAATDGIADALRIDDSKFEVSYRMGDPVKGGAVLVIIEERP
jgi:crossover junction endodeoxyribonuclease RusA